MRVSRLGYTAVRSTVALWSVWVLVGTFHVTGYARQDRSVAEGVYSDSQATRGEGTYRHVYIKARTPQLNGKVERCHRTDKQEFYQLLTYTGDVDLNQKLAEWENFYNYHRPHGAFQGKTPYETLREKLG